jgi:predicted RNA polymerase sigma factor
LPATTDKEHRTGSAQAAAEAYRRAIGLESDPAVRRFLQAELLRVEEAPVRKAR